MKTVTIIPRHLYAVKVFSNSRWRLVRAECKTLAECAVLPRFNGRFTSAR